MMKMDCILKIAKRVLASILILIVLSGGQPALAETKYSISASYTNVRSTASSRGKALTRVDKGDVVVALGYKGDWIKVKVDGHTGYISEKDVKKYSGSSSASSKSSSSSSSSKYTVKVKSDKLNIRSRASKSGSVLYQVKKGTSITVTGKSGDWLKVSYKSKTGYVLASLVTKSVVTSKSSDSSDEKLKSLDKEGVVDASEINVRTDSAKSAKVSYTLKRGYNVDIIGEKGDWLRISTKYGKGYVLESLISDETSKNTSKTLEQGSKGKAVTELQKRLVYKGYLQTKDFGTFGAKTKSAIKTFQKQAGLKVTGQACSATQTALFKSGAPVCPKGSSSGENEKASGVAKKMDWFTSDIQYIFSRGTIVTVTDIRTGISFKVKRTGGYNHADSEPLTASDTAKMKKVYKSWCWDRRAIWVSIDGERYAASMNGEPHGFKRISSSNNFNGHFCIHFTNSRTHATNVVDDDHQAAINYAYSKSK